ncbi:glycine--tRNA ligase subunit beta [Oceanobacillus halotolerans]|uniref:glycine--tRNA ligase subunit beta n=1 Tax=Oceanobacillus halotolerans TaxID=2663380 RepID=UPI0013DB44D9|nr:glycine--tRNA ligase subunit beta [Oceanobacillus halotolerans]
MTKNILFEIGLEELPARFVDDAQKQLEEKTKTWLDELRVDYDSVISFSTPRRLAVMIQAVAEKQQTIEEEIKGPAVKIAKDDEGNWTKAAIGFTKGQGKSTEDIYTKEIKGTPYIFVKKKIVGKETSELLPAFDNVIKNLTFPKNMRWAKETLRYARPIRWMVALYEDEIIPLEVTNVKSSNVTYGHRFLGESITITNPEQYVDMLRQNYVIVDPNEREKYIEEQLHDMEKEKDIHIPVDPGLLNEVRNLVEYPTVFIGSFQSSFLTLPSDVLITSMKEHQRYFPVRSHEGELLAHFVGVRNGDDTAIDTVIKGNEKVLHARLSDAQFFFEEDQKHSIDHYLQKLEKVVFQDKLGTISNKVKRVVHLTEHFARLLKADTNTEKVATRAAEICKFDLTTNMVNEFTELQGIIGETYALKFGENERVAKAVREHYLPVQASDSVPTSVEGAFVSIADKLDTIVGCISVGLLPTGSQDPHGLRRQAIGILKIMHEKGWQISLESLLDIAYDLYQTLDIKQNSFDQVKEDINGFFRLRMTYMLKELAVEQDVIDAVLHQEIGVISYTIEKARLLSKKRHDEQYKFYQESFVRILKLSKADNPTKVDESIFETSSEKELYRMYDIAKEAYQKAKENQDALDALNQLDKLAQPIHEFFENNMVMAKDETIRNNRQSLVTLIAQLIYDFADLAAIEWKQQQL